MDDDTTSAKKNPHRGEETFILTFMSIAVLIIILSFFMGVKYGIVNSWTTDIKVLVITSIAFFIFLMFGVKIHYEYGKFDERYSGFLQTNALDYYFDHEFLIKEIGMLVFLNAFIITSSCLLGEADEIIIVAALLILLNYLYLVVRLTSGLKYMVDNRHKLVFKDDEERVNFIRDENKIFKLIIAYTSINLLHFVVVLAFLIRNAKKLINLINSTHTTEGDVGGEGKEKMPSIKDALNER